MAVRLSQYSKEEVARRGDEIYERDIRSHVEADNRGRIVAIDIETGEYEVGKNILVASKALQARKPDAQIWVVRVGQRAIHRIGRLQTEIE